ncbi:MAG: flagellar hook-basal body complex protein FliE [Treponema sp.]|nr:flagellar hook-basal body complex protein FliE [Treponema sp.]
MELSFGTLQLNRSNPAHLGTSPINVTNTIGKNEETPVKGQFESFLLDAVNEMNSQQMNVSKIQEQIITDPDSVDIHDVTVAMAKAKMSMNLAQTVIDRLVNGWQELSQNR